MILNLRCQYKEHRAWFSILQKLHQKRISNRSMKATKYHYPACLHRLSEWIHMDHYPLLVSWIKDHSFSDRVTIQNTAPDRKSCLEDKLVRTSRVKTVKLCKRCKQDTFSHPTLSLQLRGGPLTCELLLISQKLADMVLLNSGRLHQQTSAKETKRE